MKQRINKYPDGNIWSEYYLNNRNQLNGLFIYYYTNGNICSKTNYINNKQFGLDKRYNNKNNKPRIITYYL